MQAKETKQWHCDDLLLMCYILHVDRSVLRTDGCRALALYRTDLYVTSESEVEPSSINLIAKGLLHGELI